MFYHGATSHSRLKYKSLNVVTNYLYIFINFYYNNILIPCVSTVNIVIIFFIISNLFTYLSVYLSIFISYLGNVNI